MIKKVLITGIDSFTGGYLSSYLKGFGYDVFGTSRKYESGKIYKCDLADISSIVRVIDLIRPDYIIHLAGISSATHDNSADFYIVNSIGSINILDGLLNARHFPSKVVMVSSAAAYGDQKTSWLNETLCCTPKNHYGASKYLMECLSKKYFSKLDIVIARPFNYTGIGQSCHFLIPKLVEHYRKRKDVVELGNIDIVREFNDINFACAAYKRLMESAASGEVVNIASGRGISIENIICMMNDIARYDIKVAVNPSLVRQGEIKTVIGSPNKLFSLVGEIHQKEFSGTLRDMYATEQD